MGTSKRAVKCYVFKYPFWNEEYEIHVGVRVRGRYSYFAKGEFNLGDRKIFISGNHWRATLFHELLEASLTILKTRYKGEEVSQEFLFLFSHTTMCTLCEVGGSGILRLHDFILKRFYESPEGRLYGERPLLKRELKDGTVTVKEFEEQEVDV